MSRCHSRFSSTRIEYLRSLFALMSLSVNIVSAYALPTHSPIAMTASGRSETE